MSGLAVWMYGRQIALFARQRDTLSLAYTPDALELGAGRPLLSISMPTRTRRYSGGVPHAFFNGLLPEGEARQMIAYDFGVADNAFDLLNAIGRDCAGALVIVPDGEVPNEDGVPEPIPDAEVAERIRLLPIAPLGVDEKIRASLAGMQQKLLLSRLGDGWGLPANGAPSTHIIKPPSQDARFPNLIANEAFCLHIARHLGLSVADVAISEFDGLPVLIIERYDRTEPDGRGHVTRVHQEDFCQARGYDGTRTRKYESQGGPSLRQCATTLTDWSQEPDQLERLLDVTTLNVLVGNADGHGKNLSLLHGRNGQIQLAPIYDVFASIWYPEHSTEPGMHVNGIRDITAITRDDLIAEATSWGLHREVAADRIEQLLSRAEDAVARAADELRPPDDLAELVQARARTFAP